MAHKQFLKNINDPVFIADLNKNSSFFRKQLSLILKVPGGVNKKAAIYIKWALEISEKNYYLSSPSQGVFSLTNRDLKSVVNFRYCTSLTDATKKILKVYNECIEIIDLHSNEKGQGSKIMKEFILLSRKIQLPLSLYAETEELVRYYQQYDFVNHGKLGNSNEFLMLRTLDSDRK